VKLLEAIGDQVDAEWSAAGRAPEAFIDIAARAVLDATARAKLDPEEIVRWVQTAPYPNQDGENGYGEPAITFARREDFRVELIFWMDGVAPIHHHASEGVFYLIDGERLHGTYDFDVKDASTHPGVILGDLRIKGVELLTGGDLCRIQPGLGFIHSLFYIGRPCLTISVRCVRPGAPFHLHKNGRVLTDAADSRTTMNRRASAFGFFVRLHPEERVSMCKEVLEHADIILASTLLTVLRDDIGEDEYATLLGVARARFGDWVERIVEAEAEERDKRTIEQALPGCRDRGARILLGLVWSGADGAMARALLERAFPGEDPLALVEGWMRALRGPRTPVEDLSAALGLVPESELSALLRRFRARLARAA
jgi:hypothetical protein